MGCADGREATEAIYSEVTEMIYSETTEMVYSEATETTELKTVSFFLRGLRGL
jgi:hypothetical protein